MEVFAVHGGLFAIAFAAATILPAQSEAALAVFLVTGSFSPATLVFVASMGNVLGAPANWGLGRGIERLRDSLVSLRPATLNRATNWYCRY